MSDFEKKGFELNMSLDVMHIPQCPSDDEWHHKYNVTRVDKRDEPGCKHDGCNYFVLDLTHDKHAKAALTAYAEACRGDLPRLAEDLMREVEDL